MKIIDSFPEKKTHPQICTHHLPPNFKAFLDALKPIYKTFPRDHGDQVLYPSSQA